MARKPTDEVQLKLRFSEALRRRLERVAKHNNRSMNTEIVHRLEQSLGPGPAAYEQMRAFTNVLAARGTEGVNLLTGAPLAEIHEKLNKIIATLEDKPKDTGEDK
jgi:hypothetical protein